MNLIKTAGALLFAWSATAVPLTDKETALLQEVFSYMAFLKSEDTLLILQRQKNHFDHSLELVQSREAFLEEKLKGKQRAYFSPSRRRWETLSSTEVHSIGNITGELHLLDTNERNLLQQIQLVEEILKALETGLIDDFVEELQGLAENTQKAPPEALYGYFEVIAEQAPHIRQIDGVIYMYMTAGDLTDPQLAELTLIKAHAVFKLSELSVSKYMSVFQTCSLMGLNTRTHYVGKDVHLFCSKSTELKSSENS